MNLFKKCLLFGFSSMFMFTSCTEQEKRFAHDEYGKIKAFYKKGDKLENEYKEKDKDDIYKVEKRKYTFYHDFDEKKCFFYKEVEDVMEIIRNLPYFRIDFKKVDKGDNIDNYDFKLKFVDAICYGQYGQRDCSSALGETILNDGASLKKGDGIIRKAEIQISRQGFYAHYNDFTENRFYNEDSKKKIKATLLHEFGHSFGLQHIPCSLKEKMENHTVMMAGKCEVGEERIGFDNYTEFDLGNLDWGYEGEYKEEPSPNTSKPKTPNRNNASKFDRLAHML